VLKSPVTGVSPAFGSPLSIITNLLPKVVPYFAYSFPEMPTFARTTPPKSWTRFQKGCAVVAPNVAPSPRIATNRPPDFSRARASVTCLKPNLFLCA